jgi:hypothetical protein
MTNKPLIHVVSEHAAPCDPRMTGRVIVIRVRVDEYDIESERATVFPTDCADGQSMTVSFGDLLSRDDHEMSPDGLSIRPVRANLTAVA